MTDPHQRPPDGALISLNPRWLTIVLIVLSGLVAAGGLYSNLGIYVFTDPGPVTVSLFKMLQLDNEGNIPTWYSSGILTLNGLLLLLLGPATRRAGLPDGAYWSVLGVVFLVLSMDETASLHEKTGLLISPLISNGEAVPFGWVIIAAPLVVILGVVYLRAILRLPARFRFLLVLSAVLYVLGAMGFETIGWVYRTSQPGWSIQYMMLTYVEEVLEIIGQTLFACVLLNLLAARGGTFRFSQARQAS